MSEDRPAPDPAQGPEDEFLFLPDLPALPPVAGEALPAAAGDRAEPPEPRPAEPDAEPAGPPGEAVEPRPAEPLAEPDGLEEPRPQPAVTVGRAPDGDGPQDQEGRTAPLAVAFPAVSQEADRPEGARLSTVPAGDLHTEPAPPGPAGPGEPALGPSEVEPPIEVREGSADRESLEAPPERKPLPLGKILALANQKGGVGKTTTAINLGAALVEQGARVLLVDFDPQGALSVGLGFNAAALELTVYNLLLDPSVSFQDVVWKTKVEELDLVPSNIDLAGAEIVLVSEVAREQALKRGLAHALERYNYILVDCPPSLGLLTINALTAADGVIIPLECEYFALRGMALLLNTIEKVRERLNPQLKVEGIVATMLDSRTIHGREVLSRVTDAFGDKLFKTVIHKTIKFAEAPVVGEPILTYATRSAGAGEYRDLAREVMSR